MSKECKLGNCIKSMSCELKVAYILILLLILSNIFIFIKLGCTKNIANWIDQNPQAILDSVQKYAEAEQARLQQERDKQSAEALKNNKDRIFSEKNVGVANKKGKKIIVEFFDYNCGYCKMASKVVDKMAREDKDIKVLFKEFPIFGGTSDLAARYSTAVAIEYPEKYLEFHSNLMNTGARNTNDIEKTVKDSGISLFKIKKVLEDKKSDIDAVLSENRSLATELGLQGTPAFVVGDTLIPGYVDESTLKSLLDQQK